MAPVGPSLVQAPRHLLVLLLTLAMGVYLYRAVEKYREGLIGVSTRDEPRTTFPFPAVTVCSGVSTELRNNFIVPPGTFPPWIKTALQDFYVDDPEGGGKKYRECPELSFCSFPISSTKIEFLLSPSTTARSCRLRTRPSWWGPSP